MPNITDIVRVDWSAAPHRDGVVKTICLMDAQAHRIGVDLYKNGAPATLTSPAVKAFFVRADGATVELTGAVNASSSACELYADLTAECYNVVGPFVFALQLRLGSEWVTLRVIEGRVLSTRTETIVETDEVTADLEYLRQRIAAAVVLPEGGNVGDALVKTAAGLGWSPAGAASAVIIGGETYALRVGTEGAAGYLTLVPEEE